MESRSPLAKVPTAVRLSNGWLSLRCSRLRSLSLFAKIDLRQFAAWSEKTLGSATTKKTGVVVNRYINVPGTAHARLGWHTDGLRDLFYGRMPKQMLNVGLHFDRIKEEDGGLRVIPGTHRQGFLEMLARKPYFVSHKADPKEHVIETEVGDMTVHDGRLWHRVEASPHVGLRSLRRSMYVPYLTDEYEPKNEQSKTPAYHYLNKAFSKLKSLRSQLTGGN